MTDIKCPECDLKYSLEFKFNTTFPCHCIECGFTFYIYLHDFMIPLAAFGDPFPRWSRQYSLVVSSLPGMHHSISQFIPPNDGLRNDEKALEEINAFFRTARTIVNDRH